MAILTGKAALLLAVAATILLIARYLIPKEDSREPPVVSSRIPFIGHLLGILRYQIDYFPRILQDTTHPIVTLPVLSGKIYVVTSAEMVPIALRQKTLDFTPFVRDFAQQMLRVSSAGLQMIHYSPVDAKSPSYMKDIHNATAECMQPGPGLADMNKKVLEVLGGFTNNIGTSWESKDLYGWFREMFTISSSRALYGPHDVISKHPELIDHLWNFEEDQALLMGMPFMARDAAAGRAALQEAFQEYYSNGHDKDATTLVQSRNRVARKWGTSLEDLAKFELSILWVTTTNAMPSAFWLLCYILSDPNLRAEIEAELQSIYTVTPSSNTTTRTATISISHFNTQTPLLASTYHETLRLQNAQMSVRKVMSDTILHSPTTGTEYLLKAGNTIQIPSGLTHTSSHVWGPTATTFDAHRFLRRDDPALTLKETRKQQTAAFFPFGGGKHLCPGRFFAQAEILGLVAVLLLGYEMEGIDEVPEARLQKFGVGVRKPAAEVRLRVRKRADLADVRWTFDVGDAGGQPLDFQ